MVNSNYVSTRFKHNSIVFLLFFAVAFLALSEPAYAQLGETKVIASDGAADDVFGWSVSISGDYAVVGAFQDDDDGSLSGSAYIYMRSGTAWSQQAKLTASDGAAGEEFGWSVSISGDYAVVGARWDDDNGISSGSAYIFKRTGTSWAQEAKLVASDGAAGDEFGFSVSISGDYTIVGAEGDDDNGSLSGSAYVFKRTGTSWAEQEKLLASDGAFGDKFGGSVSISGDDAVVGAIHDQDNGSFSGSAYVFKRSGTTWTQEAKLLPSDGAASEEFGISVSISGDYAVVGAWEDDNDNGSESGSAYVYMRSGTTWSQQAKLLSSDGAASDNFGISVAISGDIVVVGAWTSDVDAVETGSAYVFNRTGTSWAQEAKLAASDGAAFDEFGFSVSISDGYTIVAAPSDDDDGSASGSAYLFKLNTAPVITSSATASGTEDVAFSYTATATDAENDALTFTFSALSSWLSASGAVVTGTPTEGVTSGSFRVVVSDGSLTNTLDVSITVAAVNDAPVITSSATATGTEDVAFSYTVTATDAEGATITFAFSSLSSWLSASGAVVTGTPTEGVTSGSFRVVVSDGSLTNTLDVSIAIDPINDTFLTELKITPSDGVSGDGFGGSISISGNYAIIGSPFADDNGSFSGSAYVFKRTGTSWAQQAKLLPSDGAAGDEFGISVAISGDYVVVGADGDADNGSSSGSAYLFKRTGTGWAQQAKLLPSDGASGHKFGGSVSISGDYAVVSSVFDDDNGSFSGSAYVFKRSDIAWAQQAKLLASDGASGDEFGRSVSISGDYVLVGTAGDDDNGSGSGSVYTFMRSNTTWTQQNKLLASDGAASDLFGGSVSISGDYAVVGARRDDDNGSSSGSAYVFKLSGTTWVEEAKLLPTAGATEDNFGNSVSISGDFVIIGLNLDEEGTKVGSAYLFERDGTTWTQKDKLLATDGAAHDLYGLSVSISGDLIAIGAIWDNDNGSNSGSVYMYNGILPPSPPVITSSATATGTEDVAFLYTATATDAEGATITFAFSSLSSWLSASGAVVSGTPTEGITSGSFRVIASDGTLKDTLDVTVTVATVNDPPLFVDFPDSVILDFGEIDTLILSEFVLDVDDPDSLLLWAQFSCSGVVGEICVTTSADTAFINSDRFFSGKTDFDFMVTDTSGASDTVTVVIYVKTAVGIANEGLIPQEFSLSNNYPNPFNPQTMISYGLPQQSDLTLIIYNLMGQEIMRWDEQNSQAGFYQKIWNGTNKFGVPVVSGVYFYRIIAGDFVQTRKMVLLK